MDISILSTKLNGIKTRNDTNFFLLKKIMDTTKEQSKTMIQDIKNMEISVNSDIGKNIDIKV